MPEKKMVRSTKKKMFLGVCAGIADYFDVDPIMVRLVTVLLCLAWGTGLLAYLVAALALPKGETK